MHLASQTHSLSADCWLAKYLRAEGENGLTKADQHWAHLLSPFEGLSWRPWWPCFLSISRSKFKNKGCDRIVTLGSLNSEELQYSQRRWIFPWKNLRGCQLKQKLSSSEGWSAKTPIHRGRNQLSSAVNLMVFKISVSLYWKVPICAIFWYKIIIVLNAKSHWPWHSINSKLFLCHTKEPNCACFWISSGKRHPINLYRAWCWQVLALQEIKPAICVFGGRIAKASLETDKRSRPRSKGYQKQKKERNASDAP